MNPQKMFYIERPRVDEEEIDRYMQCLSGMSLVFAHEHVLVVNDVI